MAQIQFYIGLDVHKKYTQYAVRTWLGDIVQEGKCATLYKDVKTALDCYLHSSLVGMEACTSFYPLREGFLQDNISVKVANVLRIRQLVAKNDSLDARRLSDMLRLGSFPESFIPNLELQRLRDFVAVRHSFLEQRTAVKSRIWAMLTRYGIRIPERSLFSKKGVEHLNGLLLDKRCPLVFRHLYIHYGNVKKSLDQATAEAILYTKSNFNAEFNKLQTIQGIGPILSTYIIAEACPIARFASEKKLRRYAGVVPCSRESSGKSYGSMLPKYSSRHLLRWALTEAAHHAKRKKNSTLALYYESKRKIKGKQKAIMAVARCISDKVFITLS